MIDILSPALSPWDNVFGVKSSFSNYPAILINSAGNNGLTTENIFPAAYLFSSEISVAGTEDCFSQPWEYTNHNPVGYEIAAEAKSILTEDNGLFYLSNGTSYSSAIMTAVTAQIALNRITDNIEEIRNHVLNAVDYVPALNSTVANGRVVNIENHPWYLQNGPGGGNQGPGQFLQSSNETHSLSLQTSPNPFSQVTMVTMEVPVGVSAQVSLYNSVGQLVAEERIPNEQELTELQWYTPANLPAGTYFLQVQAGKEVQQQMIIKQ